MLDAQPIKMLPCLPQLACFARIAQQHWQAPIGQKGEQGISPCSPYENHLCRMRYTRVRISSVTLAMNSSTE